MSVSINPKNHRIKMTRGDTLIVTITIYDADGNEYIPDLSDQIRFALKKDYSDETPLIIKDISPRDMKLRVESSETKQLEQPGSYVYDIQITYGDGVVDTFIHNATLELIEEVE